VVIVTQASDPVTVRDELVVGRHELSARFHNSLPHSFERGELLITAQSENIIYHLISGWACELREFSDFQHAIVDIYLPGDVVGLHPGLRSRPSEKVMTLTSLVVEVIEADVLITLMTRRSTALYVTWLLGQRQRRSNRLLAAISSLDARGRIATMLLDFYTRLRRLRLITGSTYNLPLTQIQIGAYLGLTVAHVNRTLRVLRDERIVSLEKHCVTIVDLDRLTRLAENGPSATPYKQVG
jgi:CRP/FNR family transcriptional regulator, anaerobic regulatory protein